MFLNQKSVRQFVKENQKQISKEAIEALDYKVRAILVSAIKNTGKFKRIGETEVNFVKNI
jgi:ribosomal protein S18